MKARINPLIEQTSFDSAAPVGAAAVVHRFGDAGEYVVKFMSDDASIAHVRLTVGADPSGKAASPEGVSIDLAKVEYSSKMGGADGHEDLFVVRPKGYVSFTAGSARKTYAVLAGPAPYSKGDDKDDKSKDDKSKDDKGQNRDTRGFDSRRLSSDDIFTVTLMRPGDYSVVNELGKYEGKITVAYPVIGDHPYRPPSPQEVEVNDGGFRPATIKLQPAQGVIFRICTAARIKIELTRPDDGPKDRPERQVRFSPLAVREAVERWRQAQEKQKAKKA